MGSTSVAILMMVVACSLTLHPQNTEAGITLSVLQMRKPRLRRLGGLDITVGPCSPVASHSCTRPRPPVISLSVCLSDSHHAWPGMPLYFLELPFLLTVPCEPIKHAVPSFWYLLAYCPFVSLVFSRNEVS